MTGQTELHFNTALLEPEVALARFQKVREVSELIVAPLTPEDASLQSMLETSPTKWHLGHTSWFFETFILKAYLPKYQPFNKSYHDIFNSYYNGAGPQFERGARGLLSRPNYGQVLTYRKYVTNAINALIKRKEPHEQWHEIVPLLDLGCHHEEQHQELILTDIKHAFFQNPIKPAYRSRKTPARGRVEALTWTQFDEGLQEIGHDGNGFAFDCEAPRHSIYCYPFELANRPVTNREFLQFIKDDGYKRPEFWLAEGWDIVQKENWQQPLYWMQDKGHNALFSLFGVEPLNPNEPVCHISYYEADAFARWAQKQWPGARLPSEAELELAQQKYTNIKSDDTINDLANDRLHPTPCEGKHKMLQLFGDVWEWTRSSFSPYPTYQPPSGTVGEYNGKFMSAQMVLKGGSCVTPQGHIRPTYRNFFYPNARWQFTGLRLARDINNKEATDNPLGEGEPPEGAKPIATNIATDITSAQLAEPSSKIEETSAILGDDNLTEVAEDKNAASSAITLDEPDFDLGFDDDEKSDGDAEKGGGNKLASILDDDILGDDFLNSDNLGDDFLGDLSDLEEEKLEHHFVDADGKRKADFIDLKPSVESFRESTLKGLKSGPKTLYAKHFYDEEGSELFNKICKLPEYYITETEMGILRQRIRTIAQQLAEKVQLVEFGSGSSQKVQILLNSLENFDSYIPIDISREILMQSADQIATTFPNITVTAICADYTQKIELPTPTLERPGSRLGFFPGSTIGNFNQEGAVKFLKQAKRILGAGAGFIIGVDLKKDKEILERAYDDDAGVTAQFNLNLLARINRELDGNFKLNNFEHLAFYNDIESRIEMHLVSLKNQKVIVSGEEFAFNEGETIHTENSYKYTIPEFKQMVVDCGYRHAAVWEDKEHLFSVHYIKLP